MAETRKGLTEEKEIRDMLTELEKAGSPAERKRRSGRRLAAVCGNVVFAAIVILLIVCLLQIQSAKNSGKAPKIFGLSFFYIESGSMEPTLPIGSLIVSKTPKDAAALQPGDVVTFLTQSGERVTHRIVERIEDGEGVRYRTKGDYEKNEIDPEILTPDRVLGVMWFKLS